MFKSHRPSHRAFALLLPLLGLSAGCDPSFFPPGSGSEDSSSSGEGADEEDPSPGQESPLPPESKLPDLSAVLGLLEPAERLDQCLRVAQLVRDEHGLGPGESVDCMAKGKLPVPELNAITVCAGLSFAQPDPWNCSMNVEQLKTCFDAAPQCELSLIAMCLYRLDGCGALPDSLLPPSEDDAEPKDEKTLRKDAVLLRTMSKREIQDACERDHVDQLLELGLEPGDVYLCEPGLPSEPHLDEVTARDPRQACESLVSEMVLDAPFCLANRAELRDYSKIKRRCDPFEAFTTTMVLGGCKDELPQMPGMPSDPLPPPKDQDDWLEELLSMSKSVGALSTMKHL